MTRHEFWRQIIAVSDELDEKTKRHAELDANGNLPSTPLPARTGPPLRETKWRALDQAPATTQALETETNAQDDHARLEPLQELARNRTATLWKQLGQDPELADIDAFVQVRNALVIHFDERILERLPDYLRSSWTHLQTEHTGSSVGGEDFYRAVDQALNDRSLPSLVFEVYHFCLSHGFEGRHANHAAQIQEYERNLEAHITFNSPKVPRPRAKSNKAFSEPWPARRYYILTVLGAVLYAVLLTWWSNYDAGPSHLPISPRASESESAESDDANDDGTPVPSEVPVGLIGRPR